MPRIPLCQSLSASHAMSLRFLPSVDSLLQTETAETYIADFGRSLTVNVIRQVLDVIRAGHSDGDSVPDADEILQQVRVSLQLKISPTLVPVINATGVILHTNLGRAPLSQAAMQAVTEVAFGYSNLEFALTSGKRGSRLIHAEELLLRLLGAKTAFGAEVSALVVNNNAAAVLLALSALARRRQVAIARSQLVEIGGGFRVPDVMKQSGAKLFEVGTTNRVHLGDYETALAEGAALVLRAHRSNFALVGFTSEPSLAEITALAHQVDVPVVDDLGSGALLDTTRYGMAHEPTVQESLTAGVDLVCFSGDKLLGGPQAGILVGRSDLIARCKKHPLARAVRADKLCLAALSATLQHYLKDEAEREIPVWRMIAAMPENLQARAERWRSVLGMGEVIAAQSTVGGGSLPGEMLPTFVLSLAARSATRFLAKLRQQTPPVIARLEDDRIFLDPRTVLPEQESLLLDAVVVSK